jgi:HK97 family phage portal protein
VPSLLVQAAKRALAGWLLGERRTSLENPSTPLSYPAEWLLDIFNGGRTDSGIRVSEMTALQVSTCLACVQLISSAVGFLPLHVFELVWNEGSERPGKRVAYDHDSYDLLRYQPNPEMTSFSFRKTLQCHALLWGNCYAEIQRDKGNRPVALWPRNPAHTRVYRLTQPLVLNGERLEAGELVYRTSDGMQQVNGDLNQDEHPEGAERTIAAADMFHIPWLALDARVGQSTVWLTRQALGLALATEKYGAKYFGNGARPGGVLTHPGILDDPARENLQRTWEQAHGGENSHRIAILEQGLKFEVASSENEAAQFLQTRQFQKEEICAIFAVPPHMVGDTGKQNRANTEQVGIEFVTYTLGPWLEQWSQELKRKLFPRLGRSAGRYFPKFDTQQLTMPDAASRRNFYATLRQWGVASCDDIREMEDWNPIGGVVGQTILWPVNMQPAGEEPAEDVPPAPDEPEPPLPDGAGLEQRRLVFMYSRLFRDAMARVLVRHTPDAHTFRAAFGPILAAIADQLGASTFDCDASAFVTSYLGHMAERLASWRNANGNRDQVADRELAEAVTAVAKVVRGEATHQMIFAGPEDGRLTR